jgi:hypothetical protein
MEAVLALARDVHDEAVLHQALIEIGRRFSFVIDDEDFHDERHAETRTQAAIRRASSADDE